MKLVADMSLCGRPWRPYRRIMPAALFLDFAAGRYAPGRFTDLVSFSRASSATCVDSAGTLQTVAIDATRIGHHVRDGSKWVNEGLLVESESRTNLITHSIDFSSWSTSAVTITSDQVGPDGVSNSASSLGSPNVSVNFVYKMLSVGDTTTYTFSTFIKKTVGASTFPGVGIEFFGVSDNVYAYVAIDTDAGTLRNRNLSRNAPDTTTIEDFGDWWRVSVTCTNNGTGNTTAKVYIFPAVNTDAGGAWTFETGSTVAFGAQLEVASTPSSYIPTAGSTVTRAGDVLTIPTAKLPYSATAMSWARDFLITYADTDSEQTLFDWRADANNRITLTLDTSSTKTGALTLSVVKGGVSVSISTTAELSPGVDVAAKIAWRVTASEINIALDGTAETAVANTAGVPDLSSADATFGGMVTIAMERGWAADIGDTGIAGATS